jgi:hypothetical protein
MNGREWRGGLAVLAGEREASEQRNPQPHLFAYCAASGVIGTVAATAISLAVSGVARIAVWASVIGLVSLIAGLAYDSAPVNFLWSACYPSRWHRTDA